MVQNVWQIIQKRFSVVIQGRGACIENNLIWKISDFSMQHAKNNSVLNTAQSFSMIFSNVSGISGTPWIVPFHSGKTPNFSCNNTTSLIIFFQRVPGKHF